MLNVKSNKIYPDVVDNIHYEKNLGIAKHETLVLDFENIFTALESSPSYQILPQVIKRQNIASAEEKVLLADFIFLQRLRSHAIMNSVIEVGRKQGITKFQYLLFLDKLLSDPLLTLPTVAGISRCQWILYRTKEDAFPLSDSAIYMTNKSIMVALSPRLMIEVSNGVHVGEKVWSVRDSPSIKKVDEFMKRTIGNTFREIIFPEEALLRDWQTTIEFKKRVELISKTKDVYSLVYQRRERELKRIRDKYAERQQ